MSAKPFLSSKTNWLGIMVATIPFWEKIVSEGAVANYPWLLQAIGIAIVILRCMTTDPVNNPINSN